jgi:hypothetical protein
MGYQLDNSLAAEIEKDCEIEEAKRKATLEAKERLLAE